MAQALFAYPEELTFQGEKYTDLNASLSQLLAGLNQKRQISDRYPGFLQRLQEINDKLTQLIADRDKLRADGVRLNGEKAAADAQVATSQSEIARLTAVNDKLTADIAGHVAEGPALQTQIADLQAQIKSINDELAASKGTVGERDAALLASQQELEARQQQLQAMTANSDANQARIAELEAARNSVQQELAAAQAANGQAQEQAGSIGQQLQANAAAEEALIAKFKKLIDSIVAMVGQINDPKIAEQINAEIAAIDARFGASSSGAASASVASAPGAVPNESNIEIRDYLNEVAKMNYSMAEAALAKLRSNWPSNANDKQALGMANVKRSALQKRLEVLGKKGGFVYSSPSSSSTRRRRRNTNNKSKKRRSTISSSSSSQSGGKKRKLKTHKKQKKARKFTHKKRR